MRRNTLTLLAVATLVLAIGVGGVAAQATETPTAAGNQPLADACGEMSDYEDTADYQACLINHTTTTEIVEIVHTVPSNATQQQIDTVYAIEQGYRGEYDLNSTMETRRTDWMLWQMSGVQPGWYQNGEFASAASGDSTTNETANDTNREPRIDGRAADLSVQQPHYIGESVQRTTGNVTTYIVHAGHLEILPQNFDSETVVSSAVSGPDASLQYDQSTGEFVFDAAKNGTYQLTFTVAEEQSVQQADGDTTTRVVRSRYVANVQVRQASYAHIEPQRYDQLQEDSANWSEVASTLRSVGPDMPVEEELSEAIDAYLFINNPLRALQGNFTAAILILTTTNGGRLLLALLLIVPIAAVAPVLIQRRRLRKRLPDVDKLDQEKLKQWREKRKQMLTNVTPHDLPLDGRTASKVADKLGENLWVISDRLHRLLPDTVVKRIIAQAMGYHGEKVRVAAVDGDVIDAAIASSDRGVPTRGTVETVSLADVADGTADYALGDVVEHLTFDDLDRQALTADVPLDVIDAPIKPADVDDDLLDATDVSIPEDFDSKREYAEALAEVTKYVLKHDYTGEDGTISAEHSALNLLSVLTTVTAERYDVPTMRYYRDIFLHLADRLDGNGVLDDAADETGFGEVDVDLPDGSRPGDAGAD